MRNILIVGECMSSHILKELRLESNVIIYDNRDLNDYFNKHTIDIVIYFEEYISVDELIADPQKYYIKNIIYALNLFEMMLLYGVGALVFVSTTFNDTEMIKLILQDYDKAYNFRSIILKYSDCVTNFTLSFTC